MFLKKKWEFTIMETGSSKMFSWSIDKSAGQVIVSILLVFILIFGIGALYVWKKNSDLSNLTKLKKENELLRGSLGDFTTKMDSLLIKIRIMEDWENELRDGRGLKRVSPDVRALGSGGEPFVDPTFLPYGSELHKLYNETLNKLSFVVAKVFLTYETHFDLVSSLHTRESLYKATPSIWPTYGKLTDKYGYRRHPIFRTTTLHSGLDIANDKGTLIYAAADGTVSYAGRSGSSGNLVRIEHVSGYQTRYAHLDKILIRAGDFVQKGQIIASMGNSGVSTGNHLHYEVFDTQRGVTVNPLKYVNLTEEQISVRQTEFFLSENERQTLDNLNLGPKSELDLEFKESSLGL